MNAPRIRVSIDRLVLRGFDAHDARALSAALATELRRQLTDSAATPGLNGSRRLDKLNLGRLEPTATARQMGTRIARQLVRSIGS